MTVIESWDSDGSETRKTLEVKLSAFRLVALTFLLPFVFVTGINGGQVFAVWLLGAIL
jgi:hypothetical protein